jgi:hypothetical protein
VVVDEGAAGAPDLVLTGPPDALLALLAQRIGVDEARSRGLAITGDARLLRKLRPAVRRDQAAATGPPRAADAAGAARAGGRSRRPRRTSA